MSLVTIAEYRTVTGDTATATGAVQDALDDVETELGEFLGRPLANATYTDRLRIVPSVCGPMVYPKATPITDPGDYTQHGNGLSGASAVGGPFDPTDRGYASVTYEGGWTAGTLPRCIRNDVCWAARAQIAAEAPVAAGAVSVALGDASVSYGSKSGREAAEDDRWSRQTRKHRRRHL